MEALSNEEKLTLEIARSIREDYLFQNAFDKEDAYSTPQEQYGTIKSIVLAYRYGKEVVKQEEFDFKRFKALDTIKKLPQVKRLKGEEFVKFQDELHKEIMSLKVTTN